MKAFSSGTKNAFSQLGFQINLEIFTKRKVNDVALSEGIFVGILSRDFPTHTASIHCAIYFETPRKNFLLVFVQTTRGETMRPEKITEEGCEMGEEKSLYWNSFSFSSQHSEDNENINRVETHFMH